MQREQEKRIIINSDEDGDMGASHTATVVKESEPQQLDSCRLLLALRNRSIIKLYRNRLETSATLFNILLSQLGARERSVSLLFSYRRCHGCVLLLC
jgi:hypothetical protein